MAKPKQKGKQAELPIKDVQLNCRIPLDVKQDVEMAVLVYSRNFGVKETVGRIVATALRNFFMSPEYVEQLRAFSAAMSIKQEGN